MYSPVPSAVNDVCAHLIDALRFDAYGWDDIPTDCDFFLDYEIDEETWSPRKKKPWRYRWPDEVHDEVLARLLELNQRRYEEEVAAGLHDKGAKKTKAAAKKSRAKAPPTSKREEPAKDVRLPLLDLIAKPGGNA